VLAEFAADVEVRIWDSTSEVRFLVLPERPPGAEGWSETELATLVTRNAHDRGREGEGAGAMNGGHDLGGMHGLGPVEAEPEVTEPVFHAE
jgi:hypothetical protein